MIIDECQLLEPSLLNEIRLFLNFEKKGVPVDQYFFLWASLNSKKMLLQPENRAIRQRIAVSYSIPPLSLKETEKYIDYRLAVAGNDKKNIQNRCHSRNLSFLKRLPASCQYYCRPGAFNRVHPFRPTDKKRDHQRMRRRDGLLRNRQKSVIQSMR